MKISLAIVQSALCFSKRRNIRSEFSDYWDPWEISTNELKVYDRGKGYYSNGSRQGLVILQHHDKIYIIQHNIDVHASKH